MMGDNATPYVYSQCNGCKFEMEINQNAQANWIVTCSLRKEAVEPQYDCEDYLEEC